MPRDKIYGRDPFAGSGQMNTPERLEELEVRRAQHERLTRGKPARPFRELLDEKMNKKRDRDRREDEEPQESGAKDPLLGLDPNQDAKIANPGKGRRSGKVVVKG